MSKKIKVRFNLGRGVNYMKWKVQYPNGHIHFFSPTHTQIIMKGCTLKNNRATALKILRGEHKTVCAWVLCEDVEIRREEFLPENETRIKYNPRVLPFWNLDGKDMDGSHVNELYSVDYGLYIKS